MEKKIVLLNGVFAAAIPDSIARANLASLYHV